MGILSVLGVVVGAGLQLVPGVGTVAGVALMAASTAAGSAGDALIENARQNAEADRQAEEQKRITEQRIKEESEKQKREADKLAADIKAKQEAAEKEAAKIKHEKDQLELVQKVIRYCETREIDKIPTVLQKLEDKYFYDVLGQTPLAKCKSQDDMAQVSEILTNEEQRRDPPKTKQKPRP